MSWNCAKMFSISARAKCAALGWASATSLRRHSYHSQTRRGLRRKARGVASSSGLYFAHRPVCASRNVGTPLSADTPAPVSTVTFFTFPSLWISSVGTLIEQFCTDRRLNAIFHTTPNDRLHQSPIHLRQRGNVNSFASWPKSSRPTVTSSKLRECAADTRASRAREFVCTTWLGCFKMGGFSDAPIARSDPRTNLRVPGLLRGPFG